LAALFRPLNVSRAKSWSRAQNERVGSDGAFCYCATQYFDSLTLWRLSFVERNEPGHFPITDDLFLGTEIEMKRKAAELNLHRLNLSSQEAAVIIASSMVGQPDDRRRSRW
jgi:hypothetical protein